MEQNNRIFNEEEFNELSEFIDLIDPNNSVFKESKKVIEETNELVLNQKSDTSNSEVEEKDK